MLKFKGKIIIKQNKAEAITKPHYKMAEIKADTGLYPREGRLYPRKRDWERSLGDLIPVMGIQPAYLYQRSADILG